MNITLICFSQTGNTRKISNAMSEAFTKEGHIVKSLDMQKLNGEDLIACDLLGIGCPTFECTVPSPVKNNLKSLSIPKNQDAFVFATGGGAAGNVLSDLTTLLKEKEANVIGGFLSLGKIHHPAPCLVGKTPNRPNEDDLNKAENFAFALSKYLSGHSVSHPNINDKQRLKHKMGFYNLVGIIGSSDKIIRFLEPKPINNQNICKQCNLCVRECPVNNISMDPYPKLSDKCIRCYKCLNSCPVNAFSVNWRFGNVVLFALYNEFFMRWFGEYEK
ncbi:MAG: 4Fe-4S binding protein [Ignavibacteria bacterium]|nr:4Fe-4S binding protein [Ignavibacteria bacterium]